MDYNLISGSTTIQDMTVKFSSEPAGLDFSSAETITGFDGWISFRALFVDQLFLVFWADF